MALPTNVRLVKAMVFPVVVYGCEDWTMERRLSAEERMLSNRGNGKTLESSLECKDIEPVYPEGNQP